MSYLVACLTILALAGANAATVRWMTDVTPNAIEVEGVAAETLTMLGRPAQAASEWASVLRVYAEPSADAESGKTVLPPMVGSWRIVEGRVRFEPRFPLVHGVRYRAEFRSGRETPLISFFELPARKAGVPTEVVQVFPRSDLLPENQLKFYVQFSAPMSRGGIYEHLHIRDADRRVIDLPFLELDEELWDPAMTRLTLLIDPGRIKRGVKPLEDIGPVFEAGKLYSLTVEAACRDAKGRPLRAAFEKKFRIVAADRTPPDPKQWKITAPRLETREPVSVEFNEPMDHALALRLIGVVSVSNAKVAVMGETALAQDERIWTLTPVEPWKRGAYCLTVATTIEDLAGNNIGKTFDVELVVGARRRVTAASVSVPFEVK